MLIKVLVYVILVIQCVLIGLSVSLIVAGTATWVSYATIAANIAFGALNAHTLAS